MHSSIHLNFAAMDGVQLQFFSLNVDRVGGVYLVEYLPGIGQQLVQMVYIPPVVNSTIINPRRACARVTVLGLSVCVCVCVCLSVYLYSRTTGNKAARERYTRLQRNKRSKNNVADLAKTAALWQEKPAPLWTTFCDPAHQLARCACVFITRLGACFTGSALGAALPPESCVAVNATSSAASLSQNRCVKGM